MTNYAFYGLFSTEPKMIPKPKKALHIDLPLPDFLTVEGEQTYFNYDIDQDGAISAAEHFDITDWYDPETGAINIPEVPLSDPLQGGQYVLVFEEGQTPTTISAQEPSLDDATDAKEFVVWLMADTWHKAWVSENRPTTKPTGTKPGDPPSMTAPKRADYSDDASYNAAKDAWVAAWQEYKEKYVAYNKPQFEYLLTVGEMLTALKGAYKEWFDTEAAAMLILNSARSRQSKKEQREYKQAVFDAQTNKSREDAQLSKNQAQNQALVKKFQQQMMQRAQQQKKQIENQAIQRMAKRWSENNKKG